MHNYFFWCLIFVSSCSQKERSPLIGKWNLHVIESKDSAGVWLESDWMKNGIGRLNYLENDTVTVHFNPENYGDKGVEAYWYIANYNLNLDSSFVEHTRVRHSNPKEVGKTVKRYFKINNDTLIMHAREFGFRLKWIRKNE